MIIFLNFQYNRCKSQEYDFEVYTWNEVLNANPDTIYGISFAKEKRSDLPIELSKFIQLRYLNLNRNKLTSLPDFLDSLKNLEVLEASKNAFLIFPLVLTRLSQLREINLHRNNIEIIPDLIKNCQSLNKLDLSDNAISTIPDALLQLENLKMVDLTGIRFGPQYQKHLTTRRTDIKWELDPPCDCME